MKFEKMTKSYLFFLYEIKAKTVIKSLRHASLRRIVFHSCISETLILGESACSKEVKVKKISFKFTFSLHRV